MVIFKYFPKKINTNFVAFVWGLAEAIFFFIVPDVLLTFLAVSSLRPALVSCLYAMAGALVGGTILYFLGINYQEELNVIMTFIPAISSELVLAIKTSMQSSPELALLMGPLYGNPYKIYAANFAYFQNSYLVFVLVSAISRLSRFVILTYLTSLFSRVLLNYISKKNTYIILIACWCVFYVCYFRFKG